MVRKYLEKTGIAIKIAVGIARREAILWAPKQSRPQIRVAVAHTRIGADLFRTSNTTCQPAVVDVFGAEQILSKVRQPQSKLIFQA